MSSLFLFACSTGDTYKCNNKNVTTIVFETYLVGVESLGMHVVGSVLIGQVEEDTEGEVEVVGVAEAGLFPEPNQTSLLGRSFLRAVQRNFYFSLIKSMKV